MVEVSTSATTSGIDAVLTEAGHITGTVTNESFSGLQVYVGAYRVNGLGDWEYVNGLVSNLDGTYDIGHLPAGTYMVEFAVWYSPGIYAMQYYNGQPSRATASGVDVVAGGTTSDIDAVLPLAGHIAGRVTDAGGVGLEGITVQAYRGDGAGGWSSEEFGPVLTDADGNYTIWDPLPAGDYRIEFSDDSGTYATEWFDNKSDFDSADDIAGDRRWDDRECGCHARRRGRLQRDHRHRPRRRRHYNVGSSLPCSSPTTKPSPAASSRCGPTAARAGTPPRRCSPTAAAATRPASP